VPSVGKNIRKKDQNYCYLYKEWYNKNRFFRFLILFFMTEIPIKKKKGGKQPGAGRPKGLRNVATVEREKILEMAKDIIAGRTKRLIDVQSILAMGAIKVFVIRSHWEGTGKNKKLIKSKPKIVSDDDELANALDHEFGEGESPNDENSYYFVVTKDPDNQAINSLLDRTFGKATEKKVTKLEVDDVDEETSRLAQGALSLFIKNVKK